MNDLYLRAESRCHDCIALIEGANKVLICDETSTPIDQVTQCHEWVNPDDGGI